MQLNLNDQDHIETIVIGGGQTGLTVGRLLQEKGRDFVILDGSDRVGEAWRKRWDSLVVFTPSRYIGLPGLDFQGNGDAFPGKDAVADYLERYAEYHDLPISLGTRVTRVSHDGSRYTVETENLSLYADNVVVAMANFQAPKVPSFAPDLDPEIVQLHSSKYKNPSQLQDGPVLVVGIGNSGADIGIDVSKTHETYVAGKESAAIPFRIEPWFSNHVLIPIVAFAMLRVLNTSTPIGRKLRPKLLEMASPLVRVKPKDLDAATHRVGRVVGVVEGRPQTEEGEILDVTNVIWCTGYARGFSWLDVPNAEGEHLPAHERGVVTEYPGLYFCGPHFLHAVWSDTFPGMQIDARYVVNHLDAHAKGRVEQMA